MHWALLLSGQARSVTALLNSSFSSFVRHIKHLLLALKTAISDLERRLVEGLGLVKAISVRSTELVRVLVRFGPPGVAVPQLAITFIAASERVGAFGHQKAGGVLKHTVAVPGSPVGPIVLLRAQVASTRGSSSIVFITSITISCGV